MKFYQKLENSIPAIIAIDLESNSMYCYYHKICLIQLMIDNQVLLIDTLKIGLPQSLIRLLVDKRIIKVFQDMQYDIALLNYQYQCHPENVFDISIADKLIRNSYESHNLNKMILEYLNQDLNMPKSSQKSNWGIRPLTEKQIKYAANDVIYLIPLYQSMKAKLIKDYRYDCLTKNFKNHKTTDLDRSYNIESMWKIKNIDELNQAQLFRLKNMLITRDIIAKEFNKPPHWICNENKLKQIAITNPRSIHHLSRILSNNKPLKQLQYKSAPKLFEALKQHNDLKIPVVRPEHGVSLKRWISKKNNEDHKFNPQIASIIKEWIHVASSNTKLLMEMIADKTFQIKLASQVTNQDFDNIKFPGIIDIFQNLFLQDLISYLSSFQSNLNYNSLLTLYNNNKS